MKTDYINNIDGAERRFISQPIELREDGEDQFFEGYAVRFDSVTDLGYFTEEVKSSAFDDVMNDDVRGLFNHDPDVVLGRTASGSMVVEKDEKGVKYKIKYNGNDPDHVRVMEKVKRGDVSQSSFAFSISDDAWGKRDGKDHREITKLKRWYDVAPVTYPAYTDTSVAARSIENNNQLTEQQKKEYQIDLYKRDLTKRKLKLK